MNKKITKFIFWIIIFLCNIVLSQTVRSIKLNPRIVCQNLTNVLAENSGMISFNKMLWFVNDSGGRTILYAYDTINQTIKQKIKIENAINKDWEELTQDSKYIYIGDFGNNCGNRRDLCIYKILKNKILNFRDTSIIAQKINFRFPDQTNFKNNNKKHNFDCEAMFVFDNKLHIFTKNWQNEKTKYYTVPTKEGTHNACLMGSFDSDGLITAADIDTINMQAVLIGYKNYFPFAYFFYNIDKKNLLNSNKLKVNINKIGISQTESVQFSGFGKFLISSEKTKITKANIWELDLSKYIYISKKR